MKTRNYRQTVYCQNCAITLISQGDRYCEPCADEILAWLYLAEEEEAARYDDQQYVAELEAKQLSFNFSSGFSFNYDRNFGYRLEE